MDDRTLRNRREDKKEHHRHHRSRSRSPQKKPRSRSRSNSPNHRCSSRYHSHSHSYSHSHRYESESRSNKRERESSSRDGPSPDPKKAKVDSSRTEKEKEEDLLFQKRVEEQLKSIQQEKEETEEERIEKARLRRQAIMEKHKTESQRNHLAEPTALLPTETTKVRSPEPVQEVPDGSPVSLQKQDEDAASVDKGDSMFDDSFGCSPVVSPSQDTTCTAQIETDDDGYGDIRIGDRLGEGRYLIGRCMGIGMYSKVFQAQDLQNNQDVAIKVIRNNDMMKHVGKKEVELLKLIADNDSEDKFCVQYMSHFRDRDFLCLVFELLGSSLLDVIRKYGNSGLATKAIQVYARKLFSSLAFLKKLDYIHADLKPSNILVSENKTVLKLADFGSAIPVQKDGNQPTSDELVTGWYRPPEIVLGLPYGHPVDMWSAGCTIFECATGKVLFKTGNPSELLFHHMQVGSISRKLLNKAILKDKHFDENFNLILEKMDPISGRKYKQLVTLIPQRDLLAELLGTSTGEDRKMLILLHDLLKKILVLDPSKRITPEEALRHPFLNTV